MNVTHDFGDVLLSSLRKMKQPVLSVPGVVTASVLQVLGLGFVGAIPVLSAVYAGQSLGRSPQHIWIMWFTTVGLALLVPGLVSGTAMAAKRLLEQGQVEWSDLFSGMSKHYWRVVGANLLLGLATAVFGTGFFRIIGELVVGYFFAPWIAFAVLEGEHIWASIADGTRFALKNADLLLPAYVLYKGAGYLAGLMPNAFVSWDSEFTSVTLSKGWLVAAALGGAAQGYVYILFGMICFSIYLLRRPVPPLVHEENVLDSDQEAKE